MTTVSLQDLLDLVSKLDDLTENDHALVVWSDTSGCIHRKGGEFDVPLASFHSYESAKRSLDKLIADATPTIWTKTVSFGQVKVASEYWGFSWSIAPSRSIFIQNLFADKLMAILNAKFGMDYRLQVGTILIDEANGIGEMVIVGDDGDDIDATPYLVRYDSGDDSDWVSINDDVKVANYDPRFRLAVLTEVLKAGIDISGLGLLQ